MLIKSGQFDCDGDLDAIYEDIKSKFQVRRAADSLSTYLTRSGRYCWPAT